MRMAPLYGPDVGTLMVRAIRGQALAAGLSVAVRSIASRPWASATFVGMRHHVILEAAPDPGLADWTASLPETHWSVRGHLVADLVVDPTGVRDGIATMALAILTIEEDRTA